MDYQWEKPEKGSPDESIPFEPEELFTYEDYQAYCRTKYGNDGKKVALEMRAFRSFMGVRQRTSAKRHIPLIEILVENGKLRIRGKSEAISNLAGKLKEKELLQVELEKCQESLKTPKDGTD